MSKTLLRVFPFLSILLLLSLSSLLSSFALATSELFLEESLEWVRETPATISWKILVSFDTLLIFCALVWILYTYCCPQKVWRFWKKVFVFFSTLDKESNLEAHKLAENHLGVLKPAKKKDERKQFRWMRLEEIK